MKNKLFLILLCLGISGVFTGCHRDPVCCDDVERVSGPLSDCDVDWCEADYK